MILRKEKNLRVGFYTLGCRVNQYETQAVRESFLSLGFEIGEFSEPCDVYVINTCTVTAESDRKSRQMIRRAAKASDGKGIVVVAGCFSQVNPEACQKIEGVDLICGSSKKTDIAALALEALKKKRGAELKSSPALYVSDISEEKAFERMRIHSSEHIRAFVKIVDGCENNCTYCIIPKARGPVRSKTPDEVLSELSGLIENGYKEAVLTGIETASYGKDLNHVSLISLLEKADLLPGIERIRLGSLEPTLIKEDFVKRIAALTHIMPHFHLSLQSGSDRVLQRMKRKYNTSQFYSSVELLRKYLPDVTITTDIMVGFPNESDEMFRETVDFVKKCSFSYVHIFPYSKRKGTIASSMENQISENEKHLRAAALKEAMLEVRKTILSDFDGREMPVLFESGENGIYSGFTPNYIEARAKSETPLSGKIKKVTLKYEKDQCEYLTATLESGNQIKDKDKDDEK